MTGWAAHLESQCRLGILPVVATALWSADRIETGIDWLSAAEQDQLIRLQHQSVRLRFVQGRWLIRSVLAQRLGCHPVEVPLELGGNGKPFCPDPAAPSFNVSHTAQLVAAAFCERHPVGLDIEDESRRVNAEGIARRFFAEAEQDWCTRGGRQGFFEVWTRKEALVKATGEGLSGNWTVLDTIGDQAELRQYWEFHTFRICEGVQASVAFKPSAGQIRSFHLNARDELELQP